MKDDEKKKNIVTPTKPKVCYLTYYINKHRNIYKIHYVSLSRMTSLCSHISPVTTELYCTYVTYSFGSFSFSTDS
jgi:hypothetical protein